MFSIGDLVVYGNVGVCTVIDIGPAMLAGADKDKDYYSLLPYYAGKSKIFTPCDNDKVVIRAIITETEANSIIDNVEQIDLLSIDDEKQREQIYKNMIRGCDCRELFSLLKTIYQRKQKRLSEGKKITASDEKYFNMAEDKLYGELAVVLGINKDDVRDYIQNRVGTSVI